MGRMQASLITAIGATLLGAWLALPWLRPSPEQAIRRFHAQFDDSDTAEDQLRCPLIRAGTAVCSPLVGEVVRNREAPLRRYAIAALGDLACADAFAPLSGILQDPTEKDYVRADALTALWNIDRQQSGPLAAGWSTLPGAIGTAARRLLQGETDPPFCYWDAVFCAHQ
jgi:hypothetical protein